MLRSRRLASLAPALLLASASAAHAATITVDTTADTTSGCSLREAIDTVSAPGIPGSPCTPATLGANTIVLPPGRFTLTAAVQLLVQPPVSWLTIEGAGEGRTMINGDGEARVLEVTRGSSVALMGVTITGGGGGAEDQPPGSLDGGGAIANSGTLLLQEVELDDNSAQGGGLGGVATDGGAIDNVGTLTVIDSDLSGNTAGLGTTTFGGIGFEGPGTPGGDGGAIANEQSGAAEVIGTTIQHNSAGSGGAGGVGQGIGQEGGEGGDGGAIWNAGTLTVLNSTLAANSAGDGGGGGARGVPGNGGAIASGPSGSVDLINDTIVGNKAGSGGGAGGGVYAPATPPSGAVMLRNTLLADNEGGDCAAPGLVDGGGNLSFGGGGCPATFVSGDPALAGLLDNGGPADTFSIALGAGSAAIGAGQNCPATDERGVPRTGPCDIGAYQVTAPALGSVSVAATTGVATIRVSVTLDAGAGMLSVRYGFAHGATRVRTVKLGPSVVATPETVVLKALEPGRRYRYTVTVTTTDGRATSPHHTFRTAKR